MLATLAIILVAKPAILVLLGCLRSEDRTLAWDADCRRGVK